MIKYAVGPKDAPYVARALTTSDYEILLRCSSDDLPEQQLRLTLHEQAGQPWPGPGGDRKTAPLSVPFVYGAQLLGAQNDAADLPEALATEALEGARVELDGSGLILIKTAPDDKGRTFALRAPLITEYTAAMRLAGGREGLASYRLLQHTLVSVDGKPPVEPPLTLHHGWPFDLPTTKLLLRFQMRLMGGGEGNGVRVLVTEG